MHCFTNDFLYKNGDCIEIKYNRDVPDCTCITHVLKTIESFVHLK